MSWQDRSYAGDQFEPQREMRIQFRKPSTVVAWLIAINVAVFFIDTLSQNWWPGGAVWLFGLRLSGVTHFMIWQPVTYMFMHDDAFHLLFNMIALYVFGTEFEKAFGRDRFIRFYAACGLIGGVAYLLFGLVDPSYANVPVVGASGAIYGLIMAGIIFFPHIQVILLIFPVPVRVFGLILAAILLFQLISPGGIQNKGGEICHIAGALAAVAVFHYWGMLPRIRVAGLDQFLPDRAARQEGAWRKKQEQLAVEQAEVDRILAKVHASGMHSLSRKERKTLEKATRRQQSNAK